MIVLIDNYDSFTYNLVHYFGDLGVHVDVHRNDQISVQGVLDLCPKAIVLSPGPCTPREAGICLDLLMAAAPTVPVLGVCLGHQAIGDHFGGKVIRAPQPMHGKISNIHTRPSALFKGLPSAFEVTRYHSLIVEKSSLPSCLTVTAETADGIIMALSHKEYRVHGVQFHPESIASEHGHAILANFLTDAGIIPTRRNTNAARIAA